MKHISKVQQGEKIQNVVTGEVATLFTTDPGACQLRLVGDSETQLRPWALWRAYEEPETLSEIETSAARVAASGAAAEAAHVAAQEALAAHEQEQDAHAALLSKLNEQQAPIPAACAAATPILAGAPDKAAS